MAGSPHVTDPPAIMSHLPRIAVGAGPHGGDGRFVTWALMTLVTRHACQVQHFASRCCYSAVDAAPVASGLVSRHLDTWLMPREMLTSCFLRGMAQSELAIVEGHYEPTHATTTQSGESRSSHVGGNFNLLCEWLDLPRLLVLDVERLGACCVPQRPNADGLLLDGVADLPDFLRWQTLLEALWGLPVLGGLESLPGLRAHVATLAPGTALPQPLADRLGSVFARYSRFEALHRFAESRPWPPPGASTGAAPRATREPRGIPSRSLTVAVAYDRAFHCYFPDTLDQLESLGASVVDFSPLHDEGLPPDVDLVYLGCGHPERYAHLLSQNHCMTAALRNHLCAGRRIYADGGGLAYLCRSLEMPDGHATPMLGILPAVARRRADPQPLVPVELSLGQPTWLGSPGEVFRGYLNANWQVEPTAGLTACVAEPEHAWDVVGWHRALGSRVQLNFAAHPAFLRSLVEPLALPVALAAGR